MNDIIKNIESAQLKAEVPQFRVGDTVRVHALIKEGNRERVQVFDHRIVSPANHVFLLQILARDDSLAIVVRHQLSPLKFSS